MRGLSGDKMSEELIVTGSCDRDVRVWKISDEMIECVDEVKGVDSVLWRILSSLEGHAE
jgi:hypothetical protein